VHQVQDDYEELIAPLEEHMMRAVWSVCRDGDDAEEALQEALCVIWRRLGRIRRHANPKALVLRICLNAGYDVLRRKIRERERRARLPQPEGTAPSPAAAAVRRERESFILEAMAHLSRSQSVAVAMRLLHEAPYGEIARTLGCRESTARKHVERGRQRLQALLAPQLHWLREENGT